MATQNIAYADTADTVGLTITLASLATSSTLVVGRASTAVVNTSNLYLDCLLSGLITTGTSPTAGVIELWVYAPIKIATSTVTYPDSITGTDAAKTFASVEAKYGLTQAAAIITNASSDIGYSINPISIASLFGGSMPTHWGVFVTHDTAVNLNATGGNHYLEYQGIELTSA